MCLVFLAWLTRSGNNSELNGFFISGNKSPDKLTSDNISSILPITSAACSKGFAVPSACSFVFNVSFF